MIPPSARVVALLSLLVVVLVAQGQVGHELLGEADARVVGFDNGGTYPMEAGYALEAGDVNGDGLDDLVVGTHAGRPDGIEAAGEAFVIFGPLTETLYDLIDPASYDLHITNHIAQERMGAAVTVGDVNGDGKPDLVLSAPYASPGGRTAAGKVYVLFGPFATPLATIAADADLQFDGTDPDDRFGLSPTVGDLNGDGFQDLLVGGRRADLPGLADAGKLYVFYGPLSSGAFQAEQAANLILTGAHAGDWLGMDSAVGDITGDSIADLLAVASLADAPNRADAGEVYVVPGPFIRPPSQQVLPIAPLTTLTFRGIAAGEVMGAISLGDINEDGTLDMLVGGPLGDPAGRTDAGRALIAFGPYPVPGIYDLLVEFTHLFRGAVAGDRSAIAVAFGRLRGTPSLDVVVGSWRASNSKGEVYVLDGPFE